MRTGIDIKDGRLDCKNRVLGADGSITSIAFRLVGSCSDLNRIGRAFGQFDRVRSSEIDNSDGWITVYPIVANIEPENMEQFIAQLIEDLLVAAHRAIELDMTTAEAETEVR